MPNVLTFHNTRFGDTYTIHLDDQGNFSYALRYLDRVGGEAIVYDTLDELPRAHAADIVELIEQQR